MAWGSGAAQTNVPPSATNVVAIAGGYLHSLALRKDGTVVAWGSDVYGQCTIPPDVTKVVAVAASSSHSLALKGDGTVVAWGDNSYGQCTVPPDLTGVVAVAAGLGHSLPARSGQKERRIFAWMAFSRGPACFAENCRPCLRGWKKSGTPLTLYAF